MDWMWLTWILYAGLVLLGLATVFFTVWMAVEYFSLKGHFNPTDELVGQLGTVKKECSPHQKGKVYVAGAYWDAVSQFGTLQINDDIRIVEVREKFLVVNKADLIVGNVPPA